MSVCLNCLDSFVPGKSNRRGFCSLQCWRAFEHSTRSHNCLGVGRMNAQANNCIKNKKKKFVKMNLGTYLTKDSFVNLSNERFKVGVSDLSKKGKQDLKEALELQLKYLKLQLK